MSARPETIEEFLARGGEIRQVPRGAMAEAGWKDQDYAPNSPAARQRSFEQMRQAKERRAQVEREEREARKAAKVVEPLREKPAPRPKKAKPSRAVVKVRKVRKPKNQPFARPGSDKAVILETIGPEWVTVAELVEKTGIRPHHVREALRLLKARKLVQKGGTRWERHWRKAEGNAPKVPPPPMRPLRGLTAEVLESVKAGHKTASAVAAATGQDVRGVSTRLLVLKGYGLLTLKGKGYTAKWSVA